MDKTEQLQRLDSHLINTKERLLAPVPPKHKIREKEFRDFLRKEVKLTTAKIEALKVIA